MTMIKAAAILAISIIILLSSNFVEAQQRNQQGPPSIPNSTQIKKMVSELSKTLNLNDEKSEQISDLYTAHFKEVSSKMKGSKPSRNAMEAMKSKFEKQVKAILTPEQQKKFSAYMKKHEPKQNGPQQRR